MKIATFLFYLLSSILILTALAMVVVGALAVLNEEIDMLFGIDIVERLKRRFK